MFKFEELHVYQRAIELSVQIFEITKKWPQIYQYNLADQFLRACLSISLNIAEGSSRSKKDFCHFLSIARGSAYESIPLITIAYRLRLISKQEKEIVYNEINSIAKMLSKLRTSL